MGTRDLVTPERDAAAAGRVAPGPLTVACVAAWLLPGAGHFLLGRRRRAAAFFILVTASFVLGTVFNGRFQLIDSRQPYLSTLQVAACLGSGPLEVATRSVLYGAPVYRLAVEDEAEIGEGRPPVTAVGRKVRSRHEAPDSAYGTAYLWTAGLMNMLLILDVFDIGVGRKR